MDKTKQVKELRELAATFDGEFSNASKIVAEAADTIEALSTKLDAANMLISESETWQGKSIFKKVVEEIVKEIDTKSLAERVVDAELEYEKSLGIVSKKSFAERVNAELEYIKKLGHCVEKKLIVSNTTTDTTESNAKIYKISNQQQKPNKT